VVETKIETILDELFTQLQRYIISPITPIHSLPLDSTTHDAQTLSMSLSFPDLYITKFNENLTAIRIQSADETNLHVSYWPIPEFIVSEADTLFLGMFLSFNYFSSYSFIYSFLFRETMTNLKNRESKGVNSLFVVWCFFFESVNIDRKNASVQLEYASIF